MTLQSSQREVCTQRNTIEHSETLSNIAKHYQTQRNIIKPGKRLKEIDKYHCRHQNKHYQTPQNIIEKPRHCTQRIIIEHCETLSNIAKD